MRVCDFLHRSDTYIPVSDAAGNVLYMYTVFLQAVSPTQEEIRMDWEVDANNTVLRPRKVNVPPSGDARVVKDHF